MSITTLDSEMPRNLLKIDFWGFTPGHSDAVSVGWHPETKVLIRASGWFQYIFYPSVVVFPQLLLSIHSTFLGSFPCLCSRPLPVCLCSAHLYLQPSFLSAARSIWDACWLRAPPAFPTGSSGSTDFIILLPNQLFYPVPYLPVGHQAMELGCQPSFFPLSWFPVSWFLFQIALKSLKSSPTFSLPSH